MDVTFCDVDEKALDNCVENIKENFELYDLSHCEVISRKKLKNKKYDLIFANIILSVLKEEREQVRSLAIKGSHLILSGILKEQLSEIKSLYLDDYKVLESLEKNKWCALLMEKIT